MIRLLSKFFKNIGQFHIENKKRIPILLFQTQISFFLENFYCSEYNKMDRFMSYGVSDIFGLGFLISHDECSTSLGNCLGSRCTCFGLKVDGPTTRMYHGTFSDRANKIEREGGFRVSADSRMLGKGVYASTDINKAKRYGKG
jgi:hypothetical protein